MKAGVHQAQIIAIILTSSILQIPTNEGIYAILVRQLDLVTSRKPNSGTAVWSSAEIDKTN